MHSSLLSNINFSLDDKICKSSVKLWAIVCDLIVLLQGTYTPTLLFTYLMLSFLGYPLAQLCTS